MQCTLQAQLEGAVRPCETLGDPGIRQLWPNYGPWLLGPLLVWWWPPPPRGATPPSTSLLHHLLPRVWMEEAEVESRGSDDGGEGGGEDRVTRLRGEDRVTRFVSE